MYNTGDAVPSNSMKNLNDNVLVLDQYINSESGNVTKRTGDTIPVLQEQVATQVSTKLDALTTDAQSAITQAASSASDAKTYADSTGVLINNLSLAPGAGLTGYSPAQEYNASTVGDKLNRYVTVEDYQDTNSASGDWTTAIQAAIDSAVSKGISDVRGTGSYSISDTLKITNTAANGINIFLSSLNTTASFPAMNSFWDATPMIEIGNEAGNLISINLFINNLNGGGNADGLIASGYGFALSHIHIGYASDCISVIRMGNQNWPNASNWITGDYWVNNYLGLYLADGGGSNAPITEGWKYDVKFTAANYWGAIWLRRSGRYGQFRGDYDFNGKRLSVCQLSSSTGLDLVWDTQKLKFTNGSTISEFLFYYSYQGDTYVVLAEDHDVSKVSGTGSSYSVGDTLSCETVDGVSLVVSDVNVAQDNDSGINYFDILHDFERGIFGKIQVTAGYLSGVLGGLQYSSSWQYQNSFSGATDSLRGFGVSNSGSTLAFYNYAVSMLPWANITSDFVNFEKKLYLKDHKVTGAEVRADIASSATDYVDVLSLTDTSTDKYADEGSHYSVKIITNYGGCGASFDVWLKGTGNAQVTNRKQLNSAFKFRFITTLNSDGTAVAGVNLQIRQQAQPSITFIINYRREN